MQWIGCGLAIEDQVNRVFESGCALVVTLGYFEWVMLVLV